MNMQPTELTAEQMDLMRSDASAFREAWYAHHISALLSHADALAAKVERLEGERDFVRNLETDGGDLEYGRTYVRINPCGCKVACLFGDVIDKAMEETAHVAHD